MLRFRLPATYSRWVYCSLLTHVLLCHAFLCMRAMDSPRDGTSLVISPTMLSDKVMKYVKETLAEFRSSFPAAPDDHNDATMRDLLELLPFLFLRELLQSPTTPLSYSLVRSFVLRYFLVPDSATAPASPLRLKTAV